MAIKIKDLRTELNLLHVSSLLLQNSESLGVKPN